jgi:hypothetical protein
LPRLIFERTGYGPGQIRIANYGDGSTNAKGLLAIPPKQPLLSDSGVLGVSI